MPWTVYVLRSEVTGSTYVGITNDLSRRLGQHNGEQPGGAKSTRGGRPWAIVARYGPYEERGEAQSIEHKVKRLRGPDRLRWVDEA